jgi:Delta7-sterol 5-desaturase
MNPRSFNDFLVLLTLRYFIIAGLAYLICYVILRNKIAFKKIQLAFPIGKDYRHEIFYSLSSLFIFASVPSIMLLTPVKQYTQFYTGPFTHGVFYFWLAFPLTFIIHDAYFYFAHRIMHHPKLFQLFHVTHHKSTNPSPWAAFAFSIPEALVEAGIFVLLLLIMPLCKWHLVVFFLTQMLYNVYGHLGWELYPQGFSKNWFGKWINTSVNHNLHHKYFKGNYGLYFLWWDRLFGTIREDYDAVFEEVKGRKKEIILEKT